MEKEIPAAVPEKDQRKRREVPKKKQIDIGAMLLLRDHPAKSNRMELKLLK